MLLKDGSIAPRFGVLSLLAQSTPIFVYDHPAFKEVTNTAFTDGINVFVCADFMRKLVHQEDDSGGRNSGVLFLLLHELMHKLYCHVDRLKNFPHDIANIAEDLVINGKLVKGFTMLKPVPLLAEIGQGMKQEDADKYHQMAEEVVAEMLLRNKLKKEKEEKEEKKKEEEDKKKEEKEKQKENGDDEEEDKSEQNQPGEDEEDEDSDEDSNEESENNSNSKKEGNGKGKSKKSGKGSPSDEQSDEDSDEENDNNDEDSDNDNGEEENKNSNGKGKGKNKKSGKGEKYTNSDNGEEDFNSEKSQRHHISPEELIDILEKEGLMETAGKALKLPKADDVEGIGRKKDENRMKIVDAVQEALAGASKTSSGDYPGAHIAESVADVIGDLGKGKLIYKLAIKKQFMGDGQKIKYTDDEAAIPWYLDKNDLGVDPFYTGAMVPHAPDESVLVLVDTSGSTSGGDMRKQFLQEALGIKKSISSTGDSARKVFIWSADTVLRGEPVLITDANIEKMRHDGIPIFGDGGTSFSECLVEALNTPLMKKEKIKSVIYFTDCVDTVPVREDFEEYLNQGVTIVFITTPSMFNEKWNKELKWAEVYCIEEGTTVDMDKQPNQVTTNTRKNRV